MKLDENLLYTKCKLG